MIRRLLTGLLIGLLVGAAVRAHAQTTVNPLVTGICPAAHQLFGGDIFAGPPSGNVEPSFFLGLKDLGSGAVNLIPECAAGSPTPTFTRATTAWTKLSTGLWASVASGTARSSYLGADTTVGACGGYLAEGASTNLALQSRDLSNASWTKLNATGAKDQVGIDGVANSASSLTATAINASALQTITEAATASALSMYIKGITVTGTVTIQQGATTSEISASLNSSTYTRVSLQGTVLNPAIGIVLGTSGDKIAVDMVQFENGPFASSPTPTTTVAVMRNADLLAYPSAGNANTSAITIYAEVAYPIAPGNGQQTAVSVNDGSNNNRVELSGSTGESTRLFVASGGVTQASIIPGPALAANTITKMATAVTTNYANVFYSGTAATAVTTGTVPTSFTTISIGNRQASGAEAFGTIRNVCIYPTALSAPYLQNLTTDATNFLGDPMWRYAANDDYYRKVANQ